MSGLNLLVGASQRLPTEHQQRYSTLDGLRGFAALAILQLHSAHLFGAQLNSSYLAVDLFFALSGFVISHAYEQRIRKGLSIREFMLARIIRLYPLYILGTIFGAAFFLTNIIFDNINISIRDFLLTLAFSSIFIPTPPKGVLEGNIYNLVFPFLFPAWSLFFELLANFIYASMLRVLSTRVLIFIVGLSSLLLIWSAIRFDGLGAGVYWDTFAGGLGRVLYSFFCGILLFRFPLLWRGNGFFAWICVAGLVSIFATPVRLDYRLIFDLTVVLFVFPALVAISAASEGGVRTRRIFTFLGNSSYAIYTLHVPAIWWAQAVSSRVFGVQLQEFAPASGVLFAISLCFLAYALDRYCDVPVRQSITRRLRAWTQTARGKRLRFLPSDDPSSG